MKTLVFISVGKTTLLQAPMQEDVIVLVQERLSVLAAPRMVRSTFLFARLRSAGGVYLSGGLKPATETSRILTYPPLIEAGVFPTEIKAVLSRRDHNTRDLLRFVQSEDDS